MTLKVAVKFKGHQFESGFPWPIGIVFFMAFPETLKGEKVLESLVLLLIDDFFDLVEVPAYDKDVLRKITEKAQEKDVKVYLALQPEILVKKLNINSPIEEERKKAVNEIAEKMITAAELGILNAAFCTGPGTGEKEKLLASLEKSIIELAQVAEDHGVSLVLETFDTEWDKKLLFGKLPETANFVRRLRKERGIRNLKILWDLSHAPLLGESPDILKEHADVLGHIHVGCTKEIIENGKKVLKDWHPTFHTPGALNDEKDVAKLIKVLTEIKYSGPFSFEIKPEPQQTSLEVINVAKGVLYTAYTIHLKEVLQST